MSEAEAEPQKGADGNSSISLPPDCGLTETEVFLDAANDIDSKDIVIDASLVEKMSAPYTLAVVSVLRHAEASDAKVAVISPAPPFVDAFSELGLFQDLMKMEFRQ